MKVNNRKVEPLMREQGEVLLLLTFVSGEQPGIHDDIEVVVGLGEYIHFTSSQVSDYKRATKVRHYTSTFTAFFLASILSKDSEGYRTSDKTRHQP
jgi:hypothetical protein